MDTTDFEHLPVNLPLGSTQLPHGFDPSNHTFSGFASIGEMDSGVAPGFVSDILPFCQRIGMWV